MNITITVCKKCLRACCWQGDFLCEDAKTARTCEKNIIELLQLAKEHPHHWKWQIMENYGNLPDNWEKMVKNFENKLMEKYK